MTEQEKIRREKLEELKRLGINPYPAKLFPVDRFSVDLLENFKIYSKKYNSRLIHISTDEVYGDILIGRSSENYPYKPSSPYAASKAASDHLVSSYIRTYNLPAIVTNCSNNYGPKQHPEKLIPKLISLMV